MFFEIFKALTPQNLARATSILHLLVKMSSCDAEVRDKILKTCFDLQSQGAEKVDWQSMEGRIYAVELGAVKKLLQIEENTSSRQKVGTSGGIFRFDELMIVCKLNHEVPNEAFDAYIHKTD